ncbi:MAG: hypothetical protein MUF51_04250 [Vicinamibacteria bacterium]|jgi:pimeloyl-ACP methyl ester carboxylesterase|nr:hypothetical protein [Vicinamibacteria bacterium]
MLLYQALRPGPRLDRRIVRSHATHHEIPPVVFIPGILGSSLLRPDGSEVWLNFGNTIGFHDLGLRLDRQEDDLIPGPLIGTQELLPRIFGFREYADFLAILARAGFCALRTAPAAARPYHIFAYDWRYDLMRAVRRLDAVLTGLAELRRDTRTRFTLVAHSMGGLIARYYIRHGTREADAQTPVTWAGAERIERLIQVATPNAGSISALESILNGTPVGLSHSTLAAEVVALMPSIYHLLPPRGTETLLDSRHQNLDVDLHDIATWERFGWGPFTTAQKAGRERKGDREAERQFLSDVLRRVAAFHGALSSVPQTDCPVRVDLLGGDCLPTPARAIVPDRPGESPRFTIEKAGDAELLCKPGDGRVTRCSALAAHLPGADEALGESGLAEIRSAFFGAADHHGLYSDPAYENLLLRLILRPAF